MKIKINQFLLNVINYRSRTFKIVLNRYIVIPFESVTMT